MHVLGTPPAFILSQDQTLLFNLWFRSTLVNLSRFYCLLGSFPSSFRISETVPLNNSFLEFSGLHYCLFVKVLCPGWFPARRNVLYLIMRFAPCQGLFSFLTPFVLVFTETLTRKNAHSVTALRRRHPLQRTYFHPLMRQTSSASHTKENINTISLISLLDRSGLTCSGSS